MHRPNVDFCIRINAILERIWATSRFFQSSMCHCSVEREFLSERRNFLWL